MWRGREKKKGLQRVAPFAPGRTGVRGEASCRRRARPQLRFIPFGPSVTECARRGRCSPWGVVERSETMRAKTIPTPPKLNVSETRQLPHNSCTATSVPGKNGGKKGASRETRPFSAQLRFPRRTAEAPTRRPDAAPRSRSCKSSSSSRTANGRRGGAVLGCRNVGCGVRIQIWDSRLKGGGGLGRTPWDGCRRAREGCARRGVEGGSPSG